MKQKLQNSAILVAGLAIILAIMLVLGVVTTTIAGNNGEGIVAEAGTNIENLPQAGGNLVSGTYKLTQTNAGFTNPMTLDGEDVITTIDLNGQVIDLNRKSMFRVIRGATIILVDSATDKPTYYFTPDADGRWILTGRKAGTEYSSYSEGTWAAADESVVTEYNVIGGVIYNGLSISGSCYYGALCCNGRGSATDINFVGNGSAGQEESCGAIYYTGSEELTITGGSIKGNIGEYGGAVYLNESAANINGTIIDANRATYGGVIYTFNTCKTTLTDVAITRCKASQSLIESTYYTNIFEFDNITIQNNGLDSEESQEDIRGIINNIGTMHIKNSTIKDNIVKSEIIINKGTATIENTTVTGNVETNGAYGAIYNVNGSSAKYPGILNIYGGTITGHTTSDASKTYDVYLANGTLTLGGATEIGELYLPNGKKIALGTDDNAIVTGTNGASVGINMQVPGVFYSQTDEVSEDVAACFYVIDDENYNVCLSGDKKSLMLHVNNFPKAGGNLVSGTYKLTQTNAGFTNPMTINGDVTTTIDLNGQVIDLNLKSSFYVNGGGTLNIIDSAENKPTYYFTPDADGRWILTGRKAGTEYSSYSEGTWAAADESVVTEYNVIGGVIYNGFSRSGSFNFSAICSVGSVSATDINFVGNGKIVAGQETLGGAIYHTGSNELTIIGGSIKGNIGTDGGALYINQGVAKVNGTVIDANKATGYGGAINTDLWCKTTLKDVVITRCKASQCLIDSSYYTNVFEFDNITIQNNGLDSEESQEDIKGIINNVGEMHIKNSTIKDNIVKSEIIVNKGTATIENTTVTGNVETNGAYGAIYNVNGSSANYLGILNIYGGTITGHTTSDASKTYDVYLANGTLTLGGAVEIGELYLPNGKKIALGADDNAIVTGTNGASVGINMQVPGVFYSQTNEVSEDVAACFYAIDDENYNACLSGDKKSLMLHVNNFPQAGGKLVNGTYKLTQTNAGFTGKMTIDVNTTVTIDLNGNVIDLNRRNFLINGGATLNIIDTAKDKPTYYFTPDEDGRWILTGRKVGSEYSSYSSGVWTPADESVVTDYNAIGGIIYNGLDDGYGGNCGGAVCCTGSLNATDINFVGNGEINESNNTDGGAIYQFGGGALTIIGGSFKGNIGSSGGALYVNQSTVNVSGATFCDNRASICGGIIYQYMSGQITIKDTAITGNKSPKYILYNTSCNCNFELDNVTIANNDLDSVESKEDAMGIIFNYGDSSIKNSSIKDNIVKYEIIHNEGTLTIENTTITDNIETKNSYGAIYNKRKDANCLGILYIYDCTITDHTTNDANKPYDVFFESGTVTLGGKSIIGELYLASGTSINLDAGDHEFVTGKDGSGIGIAMASPNTIVKSGANEAIRKCFRAIADGYCVWLRGISNDQLYLTGGYDYVIDANTTDDVTGMPDYLVDGLPEGTTISVPAETPVRKGYNFIGWSLEKDGEVLTLATIDMPGEDLTIYAIWEAKDDVTITESGFATTYNGNAVAYEVTGTELDGFTVEYFVEDDWTTDAPTNAGTYDVRITRAEDEVYKEYSKVLQAGLVINKAMLKTPTVSGKYVYNGSAITVVLDGVADGMTTSDSLTQTEVGTYTITFTLDDNYTWAEGETGVVTWEITSGESFEFTMDNNWLDLVLLLLMFALLAATIVTHVSKEKGRCIAYIVFLVFSGAFATLGYFFGVTAMLNRIFFDASCVVLAIQFILSFILFIIDLKKGPTDSPDLD